MTAMQHMQNQGRAFGLWIALAVLSATSGCETHSFLDPSVVGRWEPTPVVLPILEQLDMIDEPRSEPAGLTKVQPQDLVPDVREYVMGPGDLVTVTVFELIVPDVESVQTRRIDELGKVRLPVIGPIKVEGLTPSELEKEIGKVLQRKGVLKDPTVSVIVQESRQNTFSVIGEPRVSGTAIGTYNILGNNFRLLDAMALARGVSGSIKKIYVIRQVQIGEVAESKAREADSDTSTKRKPQTAEDLIKDIVDSVDDDDSKPSPPKGDGKLERKGARDSRKPAPKAIEEGLDEGADRSGVVWMYKDGKWVRDNSTPRVATGDKDQPVVAQRIIEVPYDKLLDGDMRYNIVIRPGDIIRVPPPVIGNVYVGGDINRPGTYALPGDRDLTLKQLVFAAGNLSPTAIPERVDLIRRVGSNHEAVVRLNLKRIFRGTEPDIFLKPNDTINFGTNFWATPLAVVRSGFRASYGFGFVYDRNFASQND